MTQLRTIDRRGVTDENTLPVGMPEYEDVNKLNQVSVTQWNNLMDVLERIQQQLGVISGINLARGERLE